MDQIIIEAKKKISFPDFKELWKYRQLLISLAWRDIKVRYVQSYLGIIWVVLNPVINLLILSFIFGVVVKADTEGIPAILFTICGLSGWTYFSNVTSEAGNSILTAQNMVKKIYFPRIILPFSKALSSLVEFVATLLIMAILLLYYKLPLSSNFLYFPLFLMIAFMAGITAGLWISALTIRFRDVKFIVPYMVRLGLYLTPVAYSSNMVPEKFQLIYFLNPMVGVVEGFRWSILGMGSINPMVFYSLILLLILFLTGMVLFSSIEKTIADII